MSKSLPVPSRPRGASTLSAIIQSLSTESGDRPDLFTEAEWAAMQRQAKEEDNAPRVLHRKAMQGRVDALTVTTLANRAKVGLLVNVPALVKQAVDLALNGTKDDAVKSRTTLALLDGVGILTPSKAIDEEERQKTNFASAVVAGMQEAELRDTVLSKIEEYRRRRDGKVEEADGG